MLACMPVRSALHCSMPLATAQLAYAGHSAVCIRERWKVCARADSPLALPTSAPAASPLAGSASFCPLLPHSGLDFGFRVQGATPSGPARFSPSSTTTASRRRKHLPQVLAPDARAASGHTDNGATIQRPTGRKEPQLRSQAGSKNLDQP